MARYENANRIINDTANEVGLVEVTDPFSSQDESFIQLRGLLTAVGRELVELHDWQILTENFDITTQPGDTGDYPLPDDFSRMIDQTGWDRSNRVAIGGPLGPQDWAYLAGRDLVSQSIYASFRLEDGIFRLFPQPPPEGMEVSFEYISRNWAVEATGSPPAHKDRPTSGTDIILFEPILVVKFLKVKFLSAKGFDTSAAANELELMFNSRTGKDAGASILSAGNNRRGMPYLNSWYSLPDSGYGM